MTISKQCLSCVIATCLALASTNAAEAQSEALAAAIDTVKSVEPHGENHNAAIEAMTVLNEATADQVPQLLEAMDGANRLALNWLRGAIQSALENGGELPRVTIEDYFADRTRSHMGRLMAFELLTDGDEALADEIIPTLINDPSLPLRRKAVEAKIEQAKMLEGSQAIGLLGETLTAARDVDQVRSIASLLEEHGIEIDLRQQLGFLPSWHIVGPFDNTNESGYDTAFGPEKQLGEGVDLTASYDDGKDGAKVSWQEYNTVHPTAVVDLNETVGKHKGAIAYCYTEFESETEQPIDIRMGCINGHKVWLNGEEILNNQIYHVGMLPDQYSGSGRLKKGTNRILIKVCQNEQEQEWAQDWMFQVRVCESDGKAVLAKEPAARE